MSKKKKKDVSNKYKAFDTNPIVQPDKTTEMNVPIPSDENVEDARAQSETQEL